MDDSLLPNKAMKVAREKMGISQKQLAEMLSPELRVTHVAIGHYETGRSYPDRERGAAIAKLLNIPVNKIKVSDRAARKPVQVTKGSKATKQPKSAARGRATAAPQRGKTKSEAALTVTKAEEISVINALRAMSLSTRRVVQKMIFAAE